MGNVGYAVILVGLIYLVDTAHDQYRGIASVRSPSLSRQLTVASRAEKPEEFHRLMAYKWTRGTLTLLSGIVIRAICSHEDRCDPFSTDLPHSDASDNN